MFLKWIAGLLVLGALTTQAQAEEKDAPLPFDEPAAAPQLAKKAAPAAPIKVSNQTLVRTSPKVTSGKKIAAKPVAKRSAKTSTKKIVSSKAVTQKPAGKKPVVSKKKKRR
ncbi:MAG: hypothetical protein H6R07_1397 [Proteobacteria bacterium]|nr:hypothetical protein [Pseudomonadota bacterium]